MTAEQLTGVFEGFSQSGKSTSTEHGGTGLGLAISQRLCQLPECGYVLGAVGYLVKSIGRAELQSVLQRYAQKGESCGALLVEGYSDTREQFRGVLDEQGWRVEVAADCCEGFDRLAQTPRQFILLDLAMPHVDGFEILAEVRMQMRSHIPASA